MYLKLLSAILFFFGVASYGQASHALDSMADVKSCLAYFEKQMRRQMEITGPIKTREIKLEIDAFFAALNFHQREGLDLETVSWNLYPKFLSAMSALKGKKPLDASFETKGYFQGVIGGKSYWQRFYSAMGVAKKVPFYAEDHAGNYSSTHLLFSQEEHLNETHTYYYIDEPIRLALEPIVEKLKESDIIHCIGSSFRVANVVLWKINPLTSSQGPFSWHFDHCPSSAFKLLIYPQGMNAENGSVEFMSGNQKTQIVGPNGTFVLFRGSEILHRFVAPQKLPHLPVIELTIVPADESECVVECAGLNATHPTLPWSKLKVDSEENEGKQIDGIHLKGGKHWHQEGWINLDDHSTPSHPYPFHFYSHCRFPFSDKSVSLFFTEKSLTHENLATIYCVLNEARRTLKVGGDFVIKMPHFDIALACWRSSDVSFFGPEWNIENYTALWYNKGVCDCMHHRIASIFCSFYNKSFAPFFESEPIDDFVAYFGPPTDSEDFLLDVMRIGTPHTIAKEYCKSIKTTENDYTLYNQCAWGEKELLDLLTQFGFEIVTCDTHKICTAFGNIMGIEEMAQQSMYCWVRKKG